MNTQTYFNLILQDLKSFIEQISFMLFSMMYFGWAMAAFGFVPLIYGYTILGTDDKWLGYLCITYGISGWIFSIYLYINSLINRKNAK